MTSFHKRLMYAPILIVLGISTLGTNAEELGSDLAKVAVDRIKALKLTPYPVFSRTSGRAVVVIEDDTLAEVHHLGNVHGPKRASWNEHTEVWVGTVGWATSSSTNLKEGCVFANVGPSSVTIGDTELKKGEYALFEEGKFCRVTLEELAIYASTIAGKDTLPLVYRYKDASRFPTVNTTVKNTSKKDTEVSGGSIPIVALSIDSGAEFSLAGRGSRNIKVVVLSEIGFTQVAGLRITTNCVIGVSEDGTVVVDRVGVVATSSNGTQFVSQRVGRPWEGFPAHFVPLPEGMPLFRTWIDSTGKYTIQAALLDFKEGHLKLRTPQGETLTVPISRISEADRSYVAIFIEQSGQIRSPSMPGPIAEDPVITTEVTGGSQSEPWQTDFAIFPIRCASHLRHIADRNGGRVDINALDQAYAGKPIGWTITTRSNKW